MNQSRLLLMLFSVVSGDAHAHHSVAANYDQGRTIELKGAVLEVKLQSPHSLVTLEVQNEEGALEQWNIETNALPTLRRSGWYDDTVKKGDVLTVTAWPNRKPDSRLAYSTEFVTADGTVLGGRAKLPAPERLESTGVGQIAGRWYISRRPERGDLENPPMPLTAAGLNIWMTYDRRLSPAKICMPNNVPSIFYPPYLFEIQLSDSEILLHHEVWNIRRVVPLGVQAKQVEPTGVFGRAWARIEDNTLVVQSSDFPPSKWGLGMADLDGGMGDIPSSTEKRITERYSVTDEGQTLRLEYTVEDPIFLTESVSKRVEFQRVTDDTPMYPYECTIDSAARYDQ